MKSHKEHQIVVWLADLVAIVLAYCVGSYFYLIFVEGNVDFLVNTFSRNFINFIVVLTVVEVVSKDNGLFMFRDKIHEFYVVLRNTVLIATIFSVFVFVAGISNTVSRGVTIVCLILFLILSVTFRIIIKNYYEKESKTKRIVIVSDKDEVSISELINNLESSRYGKVDAIYGVVSVVQNNEALIRLEDTDSLIEYASKEIVDEVIFDVDSLFNAKLRLIIEKLQAMGLQISFDVPIGSQIEIRNMQVLNAGKSPLVTFPVVNSELALITKRVLDICIGFFGSIIALVAIIIIGPWIKLESPGPIIFKQKRVGRNGRFFEIYKLRSMGVDAEARKKELMDRNEVEGNMFKITKTLESLELVSSLGVQVLMSYRSSLMFLKAI